MATARQRHDTDGYCHCVLQGNGERRSRRLVTERCTFKGDDETNHWKFSLAYNGSRLKGSETLAGLQRGKDPVLSVIPARQHVTVSYGCRYRLETVVPATMN